MKRAQHLLKIQFIERVHAVSYANQAAPPADTRKHLFGGVHKALVKVRPNAGFEIPLQSVTQSGFVPGPLCQKIDLIGVRNHRCLVFLSHRVNHLSPPTASPISIARARFRFSFFSVLSPPASSTNRIFAGVCMTELMTCFLPSSVRMKSFFWRLGGSLPRSLCTLTGSRTSSTRRRIVSLSS